VSEVAKAGQNGGGLPDIEKLVKKSINLWLEFEMQRCRLIIEIPTMKVTAEKGLELAKEGKLELTLLPGLIRYGDNSGQDLNVRQTVGSCDAYVVRVS
jgi:hypothetical protein